MLIYVNSCDVIGHVTALDQSDPSTQLTRSAPGGETALDQSESAPHLSVNRGFHGGNKRTTNQNAPFQITTNQNEANCSTNLSLQKLLHTTVLLF